LEGPDGGGVAELEVDRSAVESSCVVHPGADSEIAEAVAVEISGRSEAEAGEVARAFA
jgi:hypothetical protein